MNFVTMFFRSIRLASRLDHKSFDTDPARVEQLIDELCAEEPAPHRKSTGRRPVVAGSMPHAA